MSDVEFFDSHCHLDSKDFTDDRADVITRAREAGVRYLVCIGSGYGAGDSNAAVDVARENDEVWATIGVHPHDAAGATAETWSKLRDLSRDTNVVAWGEIGLDYHYDRSPRPIQNQVFIEQIEIALELDLPICLHVRNAATDTLVHLRDFRARYDDRLRGIWHCFTEDVPTAEEAVDLGFYVSIPGIVTFPKGKNVRDVVDTIPLEKLVIETDSPFLTPVPHRGKRNEPAYVVETAKAVAEIKGVPLEEVAAATTANALSGYEIGRERD